MNGLAGNSGWWLGWLWLLSGFGGPANDFLADAIRARAGVLLADNSQAFRLSGPNPNAYPEPVRWRAEQWLGKTT